MIIDFQQGIITYPASGSVQQFLTYSNGYVSLSTSNGRVDVAFTHGVENYLHTESISVPNAWGPINTGVNAWLYWDIDKRTAVRTFGVTYVQPSFGPTQPTSPVNNQHWFDTNAKQMKVYKSSVSRWTVEIRVFAAKLTYTGTFSPMGSNLISPYAGTQAGLTSPDVRVGRILVDVEGKPIRKSNGAFFTTEDLFFSNGSPVNAERFDAAVLNATAMEPTAAYQIVKYVDFGEVVLATYNDTQETAIALTAESIDTNETGAVCIQGVITNPDWDWHVVGAPLWIHGTIPGYFTDADPHVSDATQFREAKPPVARVLTPHTIYFDQGLGGLGTSSSGPITLDGYVLRTGDTMSGNLSLPSTQNSSTHATTKGYVDGRTLTHLADVTITSPTNNQQLVFNGIEWVNATPPAVATNLNELTDVTITSPADLEVLQFNGIEWVNALLDIPEATGYKQLFVATPGQTVFGPLTNAYVPGGGLLTVFINGIMQYPSTVFELSTTTFEIDDPAAGGDEVLAVISDITPPYIYPPQPSVSLDSLTDVTITAPATNNYLRFSGTEWVNTAFPTTSIALDALTDVTITTPVANHVLTYNGTGWVNLPTAGGDDYYSTIYDLDTFLDTDSVVIVDPANGFTQYGALPKIGRTHTIAFKSGLTTGRRHIVRLMITVDSTINQYTIHDWWAVGSGVGYGSLQWVMPTANGFTMDADDVMVFEFFTINGGTTWYGSHITGEMYNPP